jgi:16S rRNA (guanine527-N7)-methyltransferase
VNEATQPIEQAFADAGIVGLPAGAYVQFLAYLELLQRWNSRLNLTAVREAELIIRRHFVECAFTAQQLPAEIDTLLDYGSGAGFPGIPIAICRPEIRVTLVESQGKKASFLREAVRVVGTPTEVFDGRVEALPRNRRFDAVSLRAVEKMELAIPLALGRVERYLVLLITEASAPGYLGLAPELKWREAVRMPNSTQRVLSIGVVDGGSPGKAG